MTTEHSTTSNGSIVQYDRVENAKVIVEILSNCVWSHIQYWSALSSKENLSRTQFLDRYKDAEERYITFQRLFVYHLVVSVWELDVIRGKIAPLASSYDFEKFISNQVHVDEFEFCRPVIGLSDLNHDMNGLFDRLMKATGLYVARFNQPSSYLKNNCLGVPVESLEFEYVSDQEVAIGAKEIRIISNFTEVCLDGFEGVVSDTEWELLHVVGCFSRRDSYNIAQEVKMFKAKLRKPLIAALKQIYVRHSAKKKLLKMFKVIWNLYSQRDKAKNTSDLASDFKPHLEFKALIEASFTHHDVNRIYKFDPKVRTRDLQRIVSRLLRVANWYVNRESTQEIEMSPEEVKYLKELASAKS